MAVSLEPAERRASEVERLLLLREPGVRREAEDRECVAVDVFHHWLPAASPSQANAGGDGPGRPIADEILHESSAAPAPGAAAGVSSSRPGAIARPGVHARQEPTVGTVPHHVPEEPEAMLGDARIARVTRNEGGGLGCRPHVSGLNEERLPLFAGDFEIE